VTYISTKVQTYQAYMLRMYDSLEEESNI